MEGTHGELGPRFTDRLCCNGPDGFTNIDNNAGGEVTAVALAADAVAAAAGKGAADANFLDACSFDGFGFVVAHVVVAMCEDLASFRMQHVFCEITASHAFPERLDGFGAVHDGAYDEAFFGAAIKLAHDDILGNVDETTGEVTRVGGTECGISQPFAGTVGRNEVFQHGEAFAEVCLIGISMVLPDGSAMRPRIPAS